VGVGDPGTDRRQIRPRNRIWGPGSADLSQTPLLETIQHEELGFRRSHGSLGFALFVSSPPFFSGRVDFVFFADGKGRTVGYRRVGEVS
jgi:hypothetical protein